MSTDSQPFLVVTALLDPSSKPAALTRAHGDAIERAYRAVATENIAGLDLVELPVSPAGFSALRKTWKLEKRQVGVYEIFPLASHLDSELRRIAGQFLAAEKVWELESKGLLGGVPIDVRLSLPKNWSSHPEQVHAKLVDAGALQLSDDAVRAFNEIKTRWDETA